MTDRTLQERLLARRGVVIENDPDGCDDLRAFGLLRGARERAVMLELRLRSGNREAFPYALLERVSFDPSSGLALRFVGAVVAVQGRNLGFASSGGVSLVDGLIHQRVAWVAEQDELQSATLPDDAVVVTRIDIRTA